MPDTAPQEQPTDPYVTRINALLDEYVAAIRSGDRTRHAAASKAVDAWVRDAAWDALMLDTLADYVDADPVRLLVSDEPGDRFDTRDGEHMIYVEHTEHVRGGTHETLRDALRDWIKAGHRPTSNRKPLPPASDLAAAEQRIRAEIAEAHRTNFDGESVSYLGDDGPKRATLDMELLLGELDRLRSSLGDGDDSARLDYLEASWNGDVPLDLQRDWRGTWRATIDGLLAARTAPGGASND